MTFDVVVIGGGQAGIPLAWALAKKGWQVALAERKYLGGSCINFGCTPTKAAIASARVAHLARRGAEFGLKIPEVAVDFPAVIRRARDIALESRHSQESALEKSENPRWLRGHARLEGPNRVRIAGETFETKQIVLNTGNRAKEAFLRVLFGTPHPRDEDEKFCSCMGEVSLSGSIRRSIFTGRS